MCVCVCVCARVCVYIHHIFIHSSIDGHLGLFHTLAIVDSAAIHIGVHVPLGISTFGEHLDECPHKVILFLIF